MSAKDMVMLKLYYDKNINYRKYYAKDNFLNNFVLP